MPCERKHIEAINSEASNWPSCGRACDGECESCYNWSKLTKAIDAALAACDESPWIPIDGVADSGVVLLGWHNSNSVAIGSKHYTDAYWKSDAGNRFNIEPTHWMPLPAAPEVGK